HAWISSPNRCQRRPPDASVRSWLRRLPATECEGPKVRRLAAGGSWIRTFGSAPDIQWFRGLVRVGADRSQARQLSREVAARPNDRVRGRPFGEPALMLNQAARPRAAALSAMRAAKSQPEPGRPGSRSPQVKCRGGG